MGLRKPILTKIGMSSSMSEEAKFEQLAWRWTKSRSLIISQAAGIWVEKIKCGGVLIN